MIKQFMSPKDCAIPYNVHLLVISYSFLFKVKLPKQVLFQKGYKVLHQQKYSRNLHLPFSIKQ